MMKKNLLLIFIFSMALNRAIAVPEGFANIRFDYSWPFDMRSTTSQKEVKPVSKATVMYQETPIEPKVAKKRTGVVERLQAFLKKPENWMCYKFGFCSKAQRNALRIIEGLLLAAALAMSAYGLSKIKHGESGVIKWEEMDEDEQAFLERLEDPNYSKKLMKNQRQVFNKVRLLAGDSSSLRSYLKEDVRGKLNIEPQDILVDGKSLIGAVVERKIYLPEDLKIKQKGIMRRLSDEQITGAIEVLREFGVKSRDSDNLEWLDINFDWSEHFRLNDPEDDPIEDLDASD